VRRLRSCLLAVLCCLAAALAVSAARADAALDLRYGPRPAQTLDVHQPPASLAAPPRPAVLLVHGGGWFAGDKARLTPVAHALAGSGFVVFNINYTLATRARPGFPVQLRDVRTALGWVEANAARFGADPRRVGALGTSAGGNLVALLATTARPRAAAGAGRLRAVATWSAPLDLATLPPGQLRGLAATFTGCPRLACAGRLADASPLTHVSPLTPPALLVNARRELVPPAQAERTASALAAAGVPQRLLVFPGTAHGRQLAPQALAPTIAFLRRWV
jgi:acetyl esterase